MVENCQKNDRIPKIKKAMSTLTRFSQSDREHDLYMRRLDYLSVENSWKGELEDALEERDEVKKEVVDQFALRFKVEKESENSAELWSKLRKLKARNDQSSLNKIYLNHSGKLS
jgi:hypothetical protein